MIFALYNPLTKQYFCPQAEFFPEKYSETLDKMLVSYADANLELLGNAEKLLATYILCMPEKSEVYTEIKKVAHNCLYYYKSAPEYQRLSNTIDSKESSDNNIHKKLKL